MQCSKYQRDNSFNINHHWQNRRFCRTKRRNHNRKRKPYPQKLKNELENNQKLFFQIKIQLTLAHKNLLTPKNTYYKKVLPLFLIQPILFGVICNVILIILSTNVATWQLNQMMRIKICGSTVRFKKHNGSWRFTSYQKHVVYRIDDHVLLSLILMIILKILTAKFFFTVR